MNKKLILSFAALVMLTSACSSLYKSIITITQVRESAMQELAALHKQGFVNPEMDAKITEADARYRAAARTAELALVAYKNGGSQSEYINALNAVKLVVAEVINILRPISTVSKIQTLESNLQLASKL